MTRIVEQKASPLGGPHAIYKNGDLAVNLPLELPGSMRAHRIMKDIGGTEGLAGTILTLDFYTFDVQVIMRYESVRMRGGPKLKLFVKDSEGTTKVVEYVQVDA